MVCDGDQAATLQRPPTPCGDSYNVTRGYRKIEGNKCDGGLDLNPRVISCASSLASLEIRDRRHVDSGGSSSSGSSGSGFGSLLIFLVLLGCAVAAVLWRRGHFRGVSLKAPSISSRSREDVRYAKLSQAEDDPFEGISYYETITPPDTPSPPPSNGTVVLGSDGLTRQMSASGLCVEGACASEAVARTSCQRLQLH